MKNVYKKFKIQSRKSGQNSFLIAFFLFNKLIFAQTTQLSTWEFNGGNTSPILVTGISAASVAVAGSLQHATNFTGSYQVSNMTATNANDAVNGFGTTAAQYIKLTIAPTSGYALDITSIAFNGTSQGRNRTFDLRYYNPSNGTLSALGTQEISGGVYSMPVTGITHKTTEVELRFYIYSSTVNNYEAAGFGEASGLDLVINGNVYSSSTVSPNNPNILAETMTITGNRITYTGSQLEFYTPVQAQWNGNKPVLSMSQYGEMNFYASPVLNYNNLYLKGTSDYSNGLSYADSFGTVTGVGGPVLFGANGGALGTRPSWDNAQGKAALSWDSNKNVTVHGSLNVSHLNFADGTVQTTGGSSWNVTNNYLTYSQDVNVQGKLKIGTNSIVIDANSNSGVDNNEIFTNSGDLKLQSNGINSAGNTIINANGGKVLIRASALPANLSNLTPAPDLFVNGDIYATGTIASSQATIYLGNPGIVPGAGITAIPNSLYLNSAGQMKFSVNYADRMIIGSNGNIGIGTTPSNTYKINVNGDAVVQGRMAVQSISFPDGTSIASAGIGGSFSGGWAVSSQNIYQATSGNVGIGITNPISKLHVKNGNVMVENGSVITEYMEVGIQLITYGNIIADGGAIGIGTDSPQAALHVVGDVLVSGGNINVCVAGGSCPDYVFEDSYKLNSLENIEKYIRQNKHLPEIPSAKEVEGNGLNVAQMNLLLLKKVEELTIYMIEANKRIKDLESILKK